MKILAKRPNDEPAELIEVENSDAAIRNVLGGSLRKSRYSLTRCCCISRTVEPWDIEEIRLRSEIFTDRSLFAGVIPKAESLGT